ncbi:MAG TPA: ATP-binding cassette domain-containing protein [Dehalococcoidia bacterium]|nr:ATP-binding cassette domain-containing protein [Dehalococcoidia bacterium]
MTVNFECVVVRKGGHVILDIPSLALASDGVTAVLGPNGSGKTTLLRCAAGLEEAHHGHVYLAESMNRSPSVSVAFQSPVFVHGTVRRNLDLALALRRVAPAERWSRIERYAALLGISALLERDARSLSGGEAQRANLARALAVPADVTLLDEPLAGVDDPTAQDLLGLLPNAFRAAAAPVVVVTHERDEALRLADRAVVVLDGLVAAQGDLPDLFRSPPTPAVAALLGYTLVPVDSRLVAIAPGELRQGTHGLKLELAVDRIHDLTFRREAHGLIGDVRATAWVGDDVSPGRTIEVVARRDRVVEFDSNGARAADRIRSQGTPEPPS